MFENLRIKNYRILQHVEFEKLSHVNLLAGRNNVGKSTVLEAINLFAKLGSPSLIEKLLEQRDDLLEIENSREKFYLPVAHLFPQGKFPVSGAEREIYIGDFEGTENLTLKRVFYVNRELSPNDLKKLGNIAAEIIKSVAHKREEIGEDLSQELTGEEKPQLKITAKNIFLSKPALAKRFTPAGTLITALLFENYDRDEYGKAESRLIADLDIEYPVEYVPTGIIDSEELAKIWDKISLSSEEQEVIEALQLVDPRVERLSFIKKRYNNQRAAIVKLTGHPTPIPIKNLGDGMSRTLQLILLLLQVKAGGFLLIDEFENGLHYSVQPKVWEMIFVLAKKFGIQVFATTHSKDTVESFGKIWQKHEDFGSYHRLSLIKGNIQTVPYDCETLVGSLEDHVETR